LEGQRSAVERPKDEGQPTACTDGPLMPPTEALGFYRQVTSK
jgi:hypothetical protein